MPTDTLTADPRIAEEYLLSYTDRASRAYPRILEGAAKTVLKLGLPSFIEDSLLMLQEFGHGGKHMRGGLLTLGAQLVNHNLGTDSEILKASIAYELLHACLLIHDDIMDRDKMRRGRDSFHIALAKKAPSWGIRGSSSHFGTSMALNTGDLGVFMALRLLSSLEINPTRFVPAFQRLTEIFENTALGQALDVTLGLRTDATEDDILRIYELKTAWYSIAGPLEIGAILSGASNELVANLHELGILLGQAFQIEDDILGLFADERVLGKPIGSDLKEGKKTLLLLKLLQMSGSKEQAFIRCLVGQRRIAQRDLKKVRAIAQETGALEYCTVYGHKLSAKGMAKIPEITEDPEMQALLRSFATYVTQRQW
jgi:geranylgeranyl diphosphate synthase type I